MAQDDSSCHMECSGLLPDKLYGRETPKEELRNVFDDICAGDCRLALIPGKSGVGKTALAESFRTTVEDRGGVFIQGKFDQYSHSTPYSAFRQATNQLLNLFLQETPSYQQKIRDEVLNALGSLSGVITEFVPGFERFLGKQPQLQAISSQEAIHRFLNAFSQLFKAVCKPEQPLVMFLDDWQWSDAASLLLLKDILLNQGHKNLLIIAAYRNDEVEKTHPFAQTLNDLDRISDRIHEILPGNLTTGEIKELVEDTFGTTENLQFLVDLILENTEGNAIFVRELLVYLCEEGFIYRDAHQQWRFDSERISQDKGIPDSIVDLYSSKLDCQSDAFKEIISIAACLGNTFNLELLSISTGLSAEVLTKTLELAKALGFIYNETPQGSVQQLYSFRHDRIQQAAHRLIPDNRLAETHLRIGRLFLNIMTGDALEENLFEVAHHLNRGSSLVDAPEEKIKLIEINVNAATKARQSVAYKAMYDFHRSAISLIDEKVSRVLWTDHKPLGLKLFTGRAESEFLEGSKSEAEQSLLFAEKKAESILDKTEILNDLIIIYTLTANYQDAIRTAQRALDLLGHTFPEDNFEATRDAEIDRIRDFLSRQNEDYLQSLPTMTDPQVKMATKIMITMGPPCYRSHQRLWGVIVAKVVSLVLEYGDIPQIGYAHTAFAGLLIWTRKDFALAKRFGEAAIEVMNTKFPDPSAQSVFYLMVGSSYRHWFRPLEQSSDDYLQAYDVGVRSGNLQYAAYGFGHNMYCKFFRGANLEELISDTRHSLEFSQTRLNQWGIDLFEGGLHLFHKLSGTDETHGVERDFEQCYLTVIKSRNNIQVRCIYHVINAFILMVMNDHSEALLESDRAEEIIYTVGTQGLLPWPEHRITRFMILSALYKDVDKPQQSRWRSEMSNILEDLILWAKHCPQNYQHKLLLAKAEMARIDGQHDTATQLYIDAGQEAEKNDFMQWLAIANERASEFYETCGLSRLGMFYWQEAYFYYKRWGALVKVRQLQSHFKLLSFEERQGNDGGVHFSEAELNSFAEQAFAGIDRQVISEEKEKLKSEIADKSIELSKALEYLQQEISNRKKSERQAHLNELRMQLALDSAKMGVWSYDMVENRRYFDETTCELLGIDPTRFTGQTEEFFAAVHPEDRDNIRQGINAAVEKDIPYGLEFRSVHPDGEIVYLKNHGKVVRDELGKPERLYGILMDVSSQVLYQKERDQLIQSLKEKTEQQERFAYTVSHDLKAPLVTINGFLGLLEQEFKDNNLANTEKYMGYIKDSSSRMKLLIDDLLRLSKVGMKPAEPTCCNLWEIIHQAVGDTGGYIRETGAKLRIDDTMPDVCVDRQGFLQVFENLLTNALKFSGNEEKPVIEIGIKIVEGDHVCYVKDNGLGIEENYQEKIFQIFEKAENSSDGTGVGLAIVKQILDSHKCKIWVESEGIGTGATFNISLKNVIKPSKNPGTE